MLKFSRLFSEKVARRVALGASILNIGWQLFLWVSFGGDLVNRRWAAGLWALFGLGGGLSAITLWFQYEQWSAPRSDQDLVQGKAKRKHNLHDRMTFIGTIIAVAGNAGDLIVMRVVGVPLQPIDYTLAAISLGTLVLLLFVAWIVLFLKKVSDVVIRRAVYKAVLAFSTRTVIQAYLGVVAFISHKEPLGPSPLLAVSVIGITFWTMYGVQLLASPSPASRATFVLWSANLGSLVILGVAFVRAHIH